MQVKPRAVRAAVEFGKGVVSVPVTIVYTDKSRMRRSLSVFLFLFSLLLFVGACMSSLGTSPPPSCPSLELLIPS
jgi:hypothetical protein